jgi:monofunctional biosynthetic peptidoglycan transglycosylase
MSRTGRWWLRGVGLALTALAALGLWEWATWPEVARLARENPRTTAFLERWRARERAAGRPGDATLRFVPYARISNHLKLAALVGEDIDFFSHHGFATYEIRTALSQAWEERELPRGASTITQQLARNLWLSPSRNPWRKAKEALLTRALERHLSKRRILELYLNVAEFGPGVWGAENAARRFFNESAADLSEREAAMLAASLPRPSTWHPGAGGRGYARYVATILVRMRASDWVRREL